jgi:hypothetical protein
MANNPASGTQQPVTMDRDIIIEPIPADEQRTNPNILQQDKTETKHQDRTGPVSFARQAPSFNFNKTTKKEITASINLVIEAGMAQAQTQTTVRSENRCCRSKFNKELGEGLYIVIGLFSAIDNQPHERIVFIKEKKCLFRDLKWAILRLRGLSYFLSLKSVKAFRLYEVILYKVVSSSTINEPCLHILVFS